MIGNEISDLVQIFNLGMATGQGKEKSEFNPDL